MLQERNYALSPSGFDSATLDRGYSLLRSGHLESPIVAQLSYDSAFMYICSVC